MRKLTNKIIAIALCLLPAGLVSSTLAGPALTITPSAVTNDYVGTVSLHITGLTTGETVRVEKFFDANGNGVIDPGELLVESFTVTDGQVPLIGGVRNSNVPGDDDGATNGQITINLFYPSLGTVADRISGNFLVRVSDPNNSGVTPAIQTFTVSQKVLPQGVSGRMTAAGSGLPLSNALVVLAPQTGNGVVGTVADTNGNYTIYSAPGSYAVICLQSGFLSDQVAGSVTINSNSFASVNLTNAVANTTVSGNVSDSSSAVGLPGLFIQIDNKTNNLFTGTFTDTNGNFAVPVTAGTWKLKLGGESGALLGYASPNNSLSADTTGGNVSNINFQMFKATALVYGSIKDTQTNPVPVMRMDAQDQGNLFQGAGQSDVNGNYSIGVIASTNLNVSPDNNSLAVANLIGQGTNVVITNGQALLLNFIVLHSTAHLRGQLVDNNSNPVPNMTLVAFPVSTNNNGISIYPNTDGNGNFDIGIYGGNWNLNLEVNSANNANLIGPNLVFSVTDGVDINNIRMVAQIATAQISGTVTDNHGTPLSGVRPFGNATANGTFYLAGGTTDNTGFYSFKVFPANWAVGIPDNDLSSRGYQTVSNQSTTISGTNNQVVNFVVQPIVNTPPTLSQPGLSGGQFHFQLNGLSGRNYRIDASTNLTSWVTLGTNTAFGGYFIFSDTNTSSFKNRFYRGVLLP
jgi:hypothetical protein